ncbi:MAG TPA: hypothetical protein DCS87_05990 [Rheinheimera sp.]|nr:hypothetical protein [Rheinheimera sp.]
MKSSRYSALYAFTLSALLLALLKSHSLVLYWQQSRHILLDVAPPPSLSELLGEENTPNVLAPWQAAQAWLFEQGRAPWPAQTAQDLANDDELAVDDLVDDEPAAQADAANPQVAASQSATDAPSKPSAAASTAVSTAATPNAASQPVAEPAEDASRTVNDATTRSKGFDAKAAAAATAKLIAAQTGKPAKSAYADDTAADAVSGEPVTDSAAAQPAAQAKAEVTSSAAATTAQSAAPAPTEAATQTAAAAPAPAEAATQTAAATQSAAAPADAAPASTEPTASTIATLSAIDEAGHIALNANDRVLLIGDSLMQGLAPHLVARFNRKHQIQTVDMSRHSTGLTYPAFYNWPDAVRGAFEKQSFNVLIVFMGANDPWDMTIKGKYIRFASDRWNEIYRERVRSILEIAKAHNTRVIWLSTPPMGREDIKAKIPQLNQLYQAEIANFADTARFIDTAPVLTTDGVTYTRFIELPERGSVMLRTDDGIHFTVQGQKLLTKLTLVQFKLPVVKKKS